MGFPVDGCGQFRIQGRLFALDRNSAEAIREHEPNGIHQPLLVISYPAYPAEQSERFLAIYELSLSTRKLVTGKSNTAVRPLSEEERAWCLRANKFTNFNEPRFQTWLEQHDLIRSPEERDVKFAYRALRVVGKLLRYGTAGPQDACSVISQQGSECGGLSNTYVAVLRANGIPARFVPGRWLGTAKPQMDNSGSLDFDRNTMHVKSEFYANGIGWVPVIAVPTGGASAQSAFGSDNGDFLALSFDDLEYPYGGGSGAFAKFYGASAGDGSWNGFKVVDRLTWRKLSDDK
jgi:transglutaminase-like putative cysteine protease